MKRLYIIALLFTGVQLQASQDLPPIIKGTIQIHNALSEPLAYTLKVNLNGIDPQSGSRFINNQMSTKGTISAQSMRKISPGISFGGGDVWSVPVEITLQRQGKPAEHFTLVEDIIGTYDITLSPEGMLQLKKSELEEKGKAATAASYGPTTVSATIGSFGLSPIKTTTTRPQPTASGVAQPQVPQRIVMPAPANRRGPGVLSTKPTPDVNALDSQGRTPLMNAILTSGTAISGVSVTGAKGFGIKIGPEGVTYGEGATINKGKKSASNLPLIQNLLQRGADVNKQDNEGNSALMFAAQKGFTDVVQLLLNNNANIAQRNNAGNTAISIAQDNNNKELADLLEKHESESHDFR